jgi:hypothetical protein
MLCIHRFLPLRARKHTQPVRRYPAGSIVYFISHVPRLVWHNAASRPERDRSIFDLSLMLLTYPIAVTVWIVVCDSWPALFTGYDRATSLSIKLCCLLPLRLTLIEISQAHLAGQLRVKIDQYFIDRQNAHN